MAVKSFVALLILGISMTNARHVKVNADKSPKFCNGLDCPEFTVLKQTDEYDIRAYEQSAWVSTEILGMDFDKAGEEAFGRLFAYISGANEAKEKVPMTAPVITRVIPGAGPACESNFTISFFVPFKFQSNTPKPTADNVFLSSIEKHEAYVRSFPGYANQDKYLKEAEALGQALLNTTTPYRQDFFYTAGYDAPFKPFNRHNEVWFFAEE
ncbi:heme-binding protein 2-like [Amphiura filiformis]|uniref:heme-binding protein 2-like n=1 Tax=Amphiura filiformis TaxID=82378 RepID=UPI003B211893